MKFTGERFIPDCGLESEIELEHLQRYLSVKDIVTGKRVLDVATGSGYGAALLGENSSSVCGLDIDHEAVSFARNQYEIPNLEYCQGSIDSLPFPSNSFDAVVSFETIEHVSEDLHTKFLNEVQRVLVPEGFLVISTPDKHIYSEVNNYKNEFHVREYYRHEFYDFLKQFFPTVKLLDQLQELAYVLTDNQADHCKIVQRNSEDLTGKYIVALCGRENIPASEGVCSVIFDGEGSYQKNIDRVVELQDEIVVKNQHIDDGWKMIHERDATIERLGREEASGKKKIATQIKHIAQQKKDLQKRDTNIDRLQNELNEIKKKNNELSCSLAQIRSTRAWKIIQKIYWLKSKIWPF